MSTERRTTGAAASDDEMTVRLTAGPPEETAGGAEESHDNVVRFGFRERPYFDEMLQKKHPSKVFFDVFHLYPTAEGYVPVLASSVLVDTAIRH